MSIRQQVIVRENDWFEVLLQGNDDFNRRYDEDFLEETATQVRWLAALRDDDPNYLAGFVSPHLDLLGVVRASTPGWPDRYFNVREVTPSLFHLSPAEEPEYLSFGSWISQGSAATSRHRRLVYRYLSAIREGESFVARMKAAEADELEAVYDADREDEGDATIELSVDEDATIDRAMSTITISDSEPPSTIVLDDSDLAGGSTIELVTTVDATAGSSVLYEEEEDDVFNDTAGPVLGDLSLVMHTSRASTTVYSDEEANMEPSAMSTPRRSTPTPSFTFPGSGSSTLDLPGHPVFSPLGTDDTIEVDNDLLMDLDGILPIGL